MKSNNLDVTSLVDFDNPDDEFLPMTACVCGANFPVWEFNISIYDDDSASECPKCHRKFYFRQSIRVYQVGDEHECCVPDTIDFGGWTCQCGQVWSPEEIEPGAFVWTKVEEE